MQVRWMGHRSLLGFPARDTRHFMSAYGVHTLAQASGLSWRWSYQLRVASSRAKVDSIRPLASR